MNTTTYSPMHLALPPPLTIAAPTPTLTTYHRQAAGPPRVIEVEGSTDSCCDALRLSFHRHEYSLGAHYNAVVPMNSKHVG